MSRCNHCTTPRNEACSRSCTDHSGDALDYLGGPVQGVRAYVREYAPTADGPWSGEPKVAQDALYFRNAKGPAHRTSLEELQRLCGFGSEPQRTFPDILQAMTDTARERNAVYKDNYKMVAPIVRILFPDGVPPELVASDKWHLFELVLVKITRFACTNMTHLDSIHDAGIYAAMVEMCVQQEQVK